MDEIINRFVCDVFGCGRRDIDRLLAIYNLALIFGVDVRDELESARENGLLKKVDFEGVAFVLMGAITEKIAYELEKRGFCDEAERLREDENFIINYLDTWFNVEVLDQAISDIEEGKEVNREEIITAVCEEMRKRINDENAPHL